MGQLSSLGREEIYRIVKFLCAFEDESQTKFLQSLPSTSNSQRNIKRDKLSADLRADLEDKIHKLPQSQRAVIDEYLASIGAGPAKNADSPPFGEAQLQTQMQQTLSHWLPAQAVPPDRLLQNLSIPQERPSKKWYLVFRPEQDQTIQVSGLCISYDPHISQWPLYETRRTALFGVLNTVSGQILQSADESVYFLGMLSTKRGLRFSRLKTIARPCAMTSHQSAGHMHTDLYGIRLGHSDSVRSSWAHPIYLYNLHMPEGDTYEDQWTMFLTLLHACPKEHFATELATKLIRKHSHRPNAEIDEEDQDRGYDKAHANLSAILEWLTNCTPHNHGLVVNSPA